jgi:hypothetical protein
MQESGAIFYYTNNVIVRWDTIGRHDFLAIVDACRKSNRDLYMVLFPFEKDDALAKFSLARWELATMVRDVSIYHLVGLR